MILPDRREIESAAEVVYRTFSPTFQICWPLLCERVGAEVWVKHENHLLSGSFKVRGGLVYMDAQALEGVSGVVTATRGNHGQSVAFAAARNRLKANIVVPEGNSDSKNRAMRALGGELIEYGRDFQEALEHAQGLANASLHFVPNFHPLLIRGVASYAMEIFSSQPELDSVYVPIGLGSGICAVIAARDALGMRCKVIGVVAENAPAYALSFDAGKSVPTDSANTLADGLAVRVPNAEALTVISRGVERIVTVSEQELLQAIRIYFSDTHNVAEGAGAAPLAALLKEREISRGTRVGLVLTGGNIDEDVFREALEA